MSLGPAIAALAGYLVLGQRFSLGQALAVGSWSPPARGGLGGVRAAGLLRRDVLAQRRGDLTGLPQLA